MATPKIKEQFLETFIKFHNIEKPLEALEHELEKYGDKNHKPSIDKKLLEACHSVLKMEPNTIKNISKEMSDRLNRGKSKWADKTKSKSEEQSRSVK